MSYIVVLKIEFREKRRNQTNPRFTEAPDWAPHKFESYAEAAKAAEMLYQREKIYLPNGATGGYFTVVEAAE